MTNIVKIDKCRICRSSHLISVLNLGEQALTGVFPTSPSAEVPTGPLEMVWCGDCGLAQLSCEYPSDQMYGENYGYRSGLNLSMVTHLTNIVRRLERLLPLKSDDVVLDIGSNDGTLLAQYSSPDVVRIGIDPTALKFLEFYAAGDVVVPDFFSVEAFSKVSSTKAKIITSVSMFYDLPDPLGFVNDVRRCLHEEGIWLFEQSYMPSMIRTNSYDTICHEHLEYYSLENVVRLLARADMKVLDVRFNRVNGGSFSVIAAHASSTRKVESAAIKWFLDQEMSMGFNSPAPFRDFEARVFRHRSDLRNLILGLRSEGKRIAGLGASTKGNVLLQFCGLGPDDIECIGEVNPEKFGRFTPGTSIPIVSEDQARESNPDFFLVLPWHFRDGIVQRELDFITQGGGLIFPLPEIEIVGA
jgi:SAM-dependent methyltransferase